MRRTTQALSFASTLAALAALAGCGGSGGGSSATPASVPVGAPTVKPSPLPSASPLTSPTPTPIPVVPGTPAPPGPATFTVFTANVDGQTLVSMAPAGAGFPDASHAWSAAPGAYVIYPDQSIQLTDNTGSFDSSMSSWAGKNGGSVLINPNASPQLRIAAPSSLTAAVPLVTSVLPVSSTEFDSTLSSGSVPSTFRDLVVVPSGAAMFDDEVRVFEAVGQDTLGGLVNVAPAVKWSLALPAGCSGSPAGSLAVDNANASIVTYHPPANGVFAGACYDEVVASVSSPGSTNPILASANAVYFALSQAVTFPGTVTSGGKPVPNAIVDLYGGAVGPGFGDLLALTNYSGQFVRNVPPQRPVTPFADNITLSLTNPSVAAYTLSPSNVAVGPAGGKPAATAFIEGGPFTSPYAPAPPSAFSVLNSFEVANIGLLDAQFGLPNSSGGLPACSIGAFISGQSTVAGCGGKVSSGGNYGGWSASVAADPVTGGLDFAFLQPPGGGVGQMALAVQTKITAYNDPNGSGSDSAAPHCSTAAPCTYYARYFNANGIGSTLTAPLVPANLPAGTQLQIDGVLLTADVGTTYNANIIRNEYSSAFQTVGQPERAYTEAFQYPFGASQVNFVDRWYNSASEPGGSFTFSRVNTANGFTLSGSGTQNYYQTLKVTPISYTITNGVVNTGPNGTTESYTTTATNGSTQTSVSWNWAGLAQVGSTATGSILSASGTVNATFTVDATGDVTVTESAANGGGIQQFLLQ